MKRKASATSQGNLHSNVAVGAAVVIFALVLFSIAGNTSLTGAYHIRGGTDRLYASNITFSPETNSFSVYIPGRGLVAQDASLMLRVRLANASFTPNIGLGFKFNPNLTRGWTDTVWVVVKNLTPRALLTGSVIYYNGTNYILEQEGGYYRDDWHGEPAWDFVNARLPLYFVNSSGYPNDCMHNYIDVTFEPHSPVPRPRAIFAQIEEYNVRNPAQPSWWIVKWKIARLLDLPSVYYQPRPRPFYPDQVRVGFVGGSGSSFAGSAFNGVTLKYVYNASIVSGCPIPPG